MNCILIYFLKKNELKFNCQVIVEKIRVEGHTDDQKIITGKYKTNLELSSARAVSVVEFISHKLEIPPDIFSAEGRSEFEPIVDNSTELGRGINRRVEIFIDADIMNNLK